MDQLARVGWRSLTADAPVRLGVIEVTSSELGFRLGDDTSLEPFPCATVEQSANPEYVRVAGVSPA